MTLLLILLLPFIGFILAGLMPSNARNAEAWLAAGLTVTCAGLVASLWPQVADGGVVQAVLPWMPGYGLYFHLRMDGFAWMFAMMITVIGTLVVIYARYYMSPADPVPRFFSFLLAFMGAMLGIVLSGNLIQLTVFWELTSFSSFMLIAYWYHRPDARRGARMALTVTAAGGICLLAAVLLVGQIVGSFELDRVLEAGAEIRAHRWYPAVVILLLLGAFTKSAQFPFHFWLPHAMAAPTPVSAYLHSATMVKAGVFLLARFWPVLSGTDLWFYAVTTTGMATLLLGGFAAIFQRDMKGVLAYSTISHLGLITLLLGMNSALALVAAIFHMMNHAAFKASLFMAAGIVDHEAGTRDLRRLGGLYQAMPLTATLAMVAAAAMAGVPLLNGFLSKEMFFAASIFVTGGKAVQIGLPALATLAGMFSVAYSLRFVHQVFGGRRSDDLAQEPHDPVRWMLLPVALLVLVCLLVGTLPALTVGPVLAAASESVLGEAPPPYSLAVWHGVNLPLLMSILALVGGFLIYLMLLVVGRGGHRRAPVIDRIDGRRTFDVAIVKLIRACDLLVRVLSSRKLQWQLLLLVCVALGAGIVAIGSGGLPAGLRPLTPLDPIFALLWVVGAACAIGAAQQAKFHRLVALIMVGGAGLVTCLSFAWFSAPDLALTQLSVEVVTVVLILLGLRWLPRRIEIYDPHRHTLRARGRRARDLIISVAAGGGLAALSFAVLTRPPPNTISAYFVENSLALAGGRNITNVILVDFRAFDTFGEITVLGIVALTVYALLRRFRPALESLGLPRPQLADTGREEAALPDPSRPLPEGTMKVPTVLVRLLVPMAGLVSLFFLIRGHNAPGGGFVGGLVFATAITVQYMVGGIVWVEARTRLHPQHWIGAGLLASAFAGAGAFLAGRSFLTSLETHLSLPLLGELHLSGTLLFDLGVYMLVVGATVLILVAIAHQSLRTHRRPGANPERDLIAGVNLAAAES